MSKVLIIYWSGTAIPKMAQLISQGAKSRARKLR